MTDLLDQLQRYVREHGAELTGRVLVAVLILVTAFVLARVARSAVRAAMSRRTEDRRAATLAPAVQSLTRISILGLGIVTALHQLGVNVTTVIAGAGVLGIAVGFGAQTLVRDVISGFFLIIDGVVEASDHVTFNQVSGTVEEVGLRMTKIRSIDGRLWYVPNGELKVVGNFNREWARAMVNIPLAHEQNITKAMGLIQEVAARWAKEHPDVVLEPPEAQGVLTLGAGSVDVRVVVKVRAMEHWAVERELGRLIKDAFDEHGFELPIPRQVVYHRGESAAHAGDVAR